MRAERFGCARDRVSEAVMGAIALMALPLLGALAQRSATAPRMPACVATQSADRAHSVPSGGLDSLERSEFVSATMQCMVAMHRDMQAALTGEGRTADEIFAAAMIPHHQGAVDMARQLLVHGHDPELRSLALSIIAEQQAEIALLQAWLARHSRSAADPAVAPQPGQHPSQPPLHGRRAASPATRFAVPPSLP
jgi:hypothetical protein